MTLAEAANGVLRALVRDKEKARLLGGPEDQVGLSPLAEKREDQYPIRRAVDLFNALAGKGRRQFSCQRAEEVGFHP